MSNDAVQELNKTTQDSKNMALLTWIGTLFFGFIPGLILFLVKKDDEYVQEQSKEALNWSITAIMAYLVAFILSFIVIGVFLFPIIAICHIVFCIMGAVSTSKGNKFRVPFAIRLIKYTNQRLRRTKFRCHLLCKNTHKGRHQKFARCGGSGNRGNRGQVLPSAWQVALQYEINK